MTQVKRIYILFSIKHANRKTIVIMLFFLNNYFLLHATQNPLRYETDSTFIINDSTYITSILNSRHQRLFLSLCMKTNDFKGKVAVLCMDIKRFLIDSAGFKDIEEVNRLLFHVIYTNDTLRINKSIIQNDSAVFKKYNFRLIQTVDEVNKYKKLGKEAFLNRYFSISDSLGVYKKALSKELTWEESRKLQTAIIDALFQWKVFVFFHDHSGHIGCMLYGPNYSFKLKKYLKTVPEVQYNIQK